MSLYTEPVGDPALQPSTKQARGCRLHMGVTVSACEAGTDHWLPLLLSTSFSPSSRVSC